MVIASRPRKSFKPQTGHSIKESNISSQIFAIGGSGHDADGAALRAAAMATGHAALDTMSCPSGEWQNV